MSVGLAVIGCGTVGRIRAVLAREHPAVSWIGLCDVDEETLNALAADIDADFTTSDPDDLLARDEVTAVIVATAENEHVAPIMAAVERSVPLFIEKAFMNRMVPDATLRKTSERSNLTQLPARRRLRRDVVGPDA